MKAQHPPLMTPSWLKQRPPQEPRETHPAQVGLTDEERLAAEESRRVELDEHHRVTLAAIEESRTAREYVRVIEAAEREDEIRTLFAMLYGKPMPAAQVDFHNFPENLTDKLSDWDTVQDEASLTTADLTEDVIQRLTAAKRKKFTELLNVELAELQQERGGPREDLPREAEIEKLLGLFARVGEM